MSCGRKVPLLSFTLVPYVISYELSLVFTTEQRVFAAKVSIILHCFLTQPLRLSKIAADTQFWSPPLHPLFSSRRFGAPVINMLFGAFFLALDRLQQLPHEHRDAGVGEGVAMVDPAAVECVLRHWKLDDFRLVPG